MDNASTLIIALFSKSPYALAPWAADGFTCYNFDKGARCGLYDGQFYDAFNLQYQDDLVEFINAMEMRVGLILAFPPCDDLAGCGAKHFESKRRADPMFQEKAMELFRTGEKLGAYYNCPVLTENPVGVASTLHRRPELITSPHLFGGYLPEDDVHPEYPQYIAPRDAYRKATCYWLLNGMRLANEKPVPLFDTGVTTALGQAGNSKQFLKLGGKSEKTKTIRSLTPRGAFIALHEAMKPVIINKGS